MVCKHFSKVVIMHRNRMPPVSYHSVLSGHVVCILYRFRRKTLTTLNSIDFSEVAAKRQRGFCVFSIDRFTNSWSNSRVSMPTGREDKDGGQGGCRRQWRNTNTAFTDWDQPPTAVLISSARQTFVCGVVMVQGHVTHWQDQCSGSICAHAQALDSVVYTVPHYSMWMF